MTNSVEVLGWELKFCNCLVCALVNHLPSLDLCTLVRPLPSFHGQWGSNHQHNAKQLLSTFQSGRDPRAVLHIAFTFSFFEILECFFLTAATLKQLLRMLKLQLSSFAAIFQGLEGKEFGIIKAANAPSSLYLYCAGLNMLFFEAQQMRFCSLLGDYPTSPRDSQFPIWEVLDQNENK